MTKVTRELNSAMTVADLIAELEGLPEDTRVLFCCDYGDHCHTTQALPVRGIEVVSASRLGESGYSQSGIALSREEEDGDGYYCAACDEVYTVPTCPKHGTWNVCENGEPAPDADTEETQVVILQ
jgi:hypothetical protein